MNGTVQKLFLLRLFALMAGLQSTCSTRVNLKDEDRIQYKPADYPTENLVYSIQYNLDNLRKHIDPQTSLDFITLMADELETRIDSLPVGRPANRAIMFAGTKLETVSIERVHVLELMAEARHAANRHKKVPPVSGRDRPTP